MTAPVAVGGAGGAVAAVAAGRGGRRRPPWSNTGSRCREGVVLVVHRHRPRICVQLRLAGLLLVGNELIYDLSLCIWDVECRPHGRIQLRLADLPPKQKGNMLVTDCSTESVMLVRGTKLESSLPKGQARQETRATGIPSPVGRRSGRRRRPGSGRRRVLCSGA